MAAFNPYDPRTAMLLGLGSGLLEAGQWSQMPTSMGSALGRGVQSGMASYRDAVAMKRLQHQEQLQEGMQKAQMARQQREQQAQEAYLAQLAPEQQTTARAQGVPEYIKTSTAVPKAPQKRKLALQGGKVQDQELVDGEWQDIGEPYNRRDPLYQVQGVDETGNPVTQVLRRSDVEAQLAPQAEPGELQRVTVATGKKKKPTQAEVVAVANTEAAMRDLQVAKDILFTPEGKMDRTATVAGIAGVPGSKGRTGYQAIERAVEVLLRMRTGAAAPDTEVKKYLYLYGPSPFDSDEGARIKMQQLQSIFDSTTETHKRGGFEWQGGDTSGEMPPPEYQAEADLSGSGQALPPGTITAPQTAQDLEGLPAGTLYRNPSDGKVYRKN